MRWKRILGFLLDKDEALSSLNVALMSHAAIPLKISMSLLLSHAASKNLKPLLFQDKNKSP